MSEQSLREQLADAINDDADGFISRERALETADVILPIIAQRERIARLEGARDEARSWNDAQVLSTFHSWARQRLSVLKDAVEIELAAAEREGKEQK